MDIGRITSRSPARLLTMAVSTVVVAGCGGDAFQEVSAGDCVEGQPLLEGELSEIPCSEYDASRPDHLRVIVVMGADENPDLTYAEEQACALLGVEDGDRIVCFGK